MNPGKNGSADPSQPEDFAATQGDEKLFIKYGYDGIYSGMSSYLRNQGISKVLVVGLVTSCCVHLNAYGLFDRGF